MTAKKTESKAQAVRNYIREHPDAKPQEVEKTLDSQGIKVSARYVSEIKSKRASSRARKEPKEPKEDKPAPAKGSLGHSQKTILRMRFAFPRR